jgi:DNA repair exonuclease SbcCD ATPase subunit
VIKFKKVRWRNFLSTGNEWTEIFLDRSPTTLIVGTNGSGKSTLLDALSFSLFGKPHRNINKPQLINSINNKQCEVEVEFDIGTYMFHVKRGIKPAKFEIWQNDVMINQDASARDYQKFLEQNILKLNHKSFHQIVVLGSSSFIPFMQLPAQHRRDVIEDLLDIQIFSKMNQILKEKDLKLKESLTNATYQIELTNEKITLQQKYIRDITELNEGQIKDKQKEITDIETEIQLLEKDNTEWKSFIDDNLTDVNTAIDAAKKKRNEYVKYEAQFQQKIKAVVKDAKFYEENEVCPTCTQDIEKSTRETKLLEAKASAKQLSEALDTASSESGKLDVEIETLMNKIAHIQNLNNNISGNNKAIAYNQNRINTIRTEINSLSESQGDLGEANKEFNALTEEKSLLNEQKANITNDRLYNSIASEMLKDTGIKTKVIKQYLPVMNTLINKYLQVLDFFVSFNLDESFNETIKSRHRDSFNYASFSEGEKQRIDLALLFTWRQIARMKNSTSTNLLVLDETFDSSLDHDGVDNLMKILQTLDSNTNVFVISHKGDLLDGKFRSKITFNKEHNFSKISLASD